MNKTELVAKMAENAELTKAEAARALKSFEETVTEAMNNGDEVAIVGFGTFATRHRDARTGRNPQTGAEIVIPAATVPKFRADYALKDRVNYQLDGVLRDTNTLTQGEDVDNSELIEKMASHADTTLAGAGRALDVFIDSIATALQGGDKVSIVGFGTFEVRIRAERTGHDLQTGAEITIAAANIPAFDADKALEDAVNGG